jgi:hypothetical protein
MHWNMSALLEFLGVCIISPLPPPPMYDWIYVRLSIGLLPLYSKPRGRLEPASWCKENIVSLYVVLLNGTFGVLCYWGIHKPLEVC